MHSTAMQDCGVRFVCYCDLMERRLFVYKTYVEPGEEFHFAHKELDAQRPRYAHWHDYHEVFVVERGRVRHFINGSTEMLERGAVVFIRPDDTHAFQSVGDPDCRIINVMCRQETIEHLGARYGHELGKRFFWSDLDLPFQHDLSGPRMERVVNSAMDLAVGRRTLARLELFMLSVMTRVMDDASVLPQAAPAWLSSACEAARTREVFSRGARGFVEASGRGQEHVCRETRRHLGLSPSAYVNRIRMAHAARLLREGDLKVDDIARDCGIRNLSHFHRLFRAHYGTTPGSYRRRHLVNPVQPP